MAGQLGHPDGLMMYSMLFAEGGPLPNDNDRAIDWLHKAAAAGHPTAIKGVETIKEIKRRR